MSNVQQEMSNVQGCAAPEIRCDPITWSQSEWLSASTTWTLDISCWTLDISYLDIGHFLFGHWTFLVGHWTFPTASPARDTSGSQKVAFPQPLQYQCSR